MIPRISGVQTDDKDFGQYQQNVQRAVGPVLTNPLVDGLLLPNVALVNGDTLVNHSLGRRLIGWIVTRRRASATIYDKQDTNLTPAINLVLNSSAPVVVDLYVF